MASYDAADTESDSDALFLRLKAQVLEDRQAANTWYIEARKDFAMYSGGDGQWESGDLSALDAEHKPHATFNFIQPSVSAVIGMEVSNRQEVTFLPRTTQSNKPAPQAMPQPGMPGVLGGQTGEVPGADDQGPAEVLTAGGKYFRQECDAEDEESDAFQDNSICGMGWTETRIDYDDEPEGKLAVDRCDPLEMGWDCGSSKRNLVDARRLHRVREFDKKTAETMFPGYECEDIDAAWAKPQMINDPVDREAAREYDNDKGDKYDGKKITVVEITWFDVEQKHRVADLDTQEVMEDVSTKQLKTIRERAKTIGKHIAVQKVSKKIYRYAFLGANGVLADDKEGESKGTLCQSQKGFKFNCMTGTRDRNKRQWMGIVRAMRDPQRWANALYSSTLNTVMTSGKGVMAERDAFEKPEQAEADWAQNGKIVFLKTGALSGQNPKIQQKVPSPLPPGIENMMQFAMTAMRGVSGVNLELLGGADRDQAASLEYQRRQAATTILAPFFDGLRRYRKEQGRLMLDLIRQYLSDGRLVRIVGPDYEGYVPLIRDENVTDYDIIVAESPSSPNQKEATWGVIRELLPMLGPNLSQSTGAILLKASPLPLSVVNEFKDAAEKEQEAAANQPPPPEVQKVMAETEKIKIEGAAKQQEMQIRGMEAQIGLQTTQMTLADAGEQRKHDMTMRGMDREDKQAEIEGKQEEMAMQTFSKDLPALIAQMANMMAQMAQGQAQIAAALTAPRVTEMADPVTGQLMRAVSQAQVPNGAANGAMQ